MLNFRKFKIIIWIKFALIRNLKLKAQKLKTHIHTHTTHKYKNRI